jgi:hypothetical protein
MDAIAPQPDAAAILASLSAEQIEHRLDILDAETRALKVLLRSVRARERAAARRAVPAPIGAKQVSA